MRRSLGFLFVLAGASCAIALGKPPENSKSEGASSRTLSAKPAPKVAPVEKASPVRLAPADEYFGPLKMSVLGIRNEIHDLAIRYDVKADINHLLAKRIMGTALMTEASLADWEKKYPGDDQIARDWYLLQHLYAKIDSTDAHNKAKYTAHWLIDRYPKTWYAKNMIATMGRLLREPMPTASPGPQASPSPSASPQPTESPSTAPSTAPANEPPIPNPARTRPASSPGEGNPPPLATSEPSPTSEPSATAEPSAAVTATPAPALK
ncbi:MAG: hypothetical protein JO060_05745 [Candidatus Eremiobacteraeota bacterium]|nr:hypothetical protein [Candidatus Eremiobacteraeota bacterium]